MWSVSAKPTTNASKNSGKCFNYAGLQTRAQRDDLLSRCDFSARRQFGAETRLSWKSSGLPTRVSRASVISASTNCTSVRKQEKSDTRAEKRVRIKVCQTQIKFDKRKSIRYSLHLSPFRLVKECTCIMQI